MSSKEFFFSSASANAGFAVTPGSFGPCSTFALASAGSERASALPAPSLRNSRRRSQVDFGVIPDDRMRDLHAFVRRPDAGGYASADSALRTIGGTGAGSDFGCSDMPPAPPFRA